MAVDACQELLNAYEEYVQRQDGLLHLLATGGSPADVALAMAAALEQLTAAGTHARLYGGCPPSSRGDPGE